MKSGQDLQNYAMSQDENFRHQERKHLYRELARLHQIFINFDKTRRPFDRPKMGKHPDSETEKFFFDGCQSYQLYATILVGIAKQYSFIIALCRERKWAKKHQ